MNSYTQILRKYESDLRDAIGNRDRGKGHSIDQALVLKENIDWSLVVSALVIMGNTTCAIQNFLETGIEGFKQLDKINLQTWRLKCGVLKLP